MYDNHLLYGKDGTEKILSLYQGYDKLVGTKEVDGRFVEFFVPFQPFVLAPKDYGGYAKLEGNLYYNYIKRFNTYAEAEEYHRTNRRRLDLQWFYDEEQAMLLNGLTYYKGMKSHEEVSVLSFDLETTTLNPTDEDATILLISICYRATSGHKTKYLLSYDRYENGERGMINEFCDIITSLNPSIIIGHNILSFDLPYLLQRSIDTGARFDFGLNRQDVEVARYESKFRKEANQFIHYKKFRIPGREIVDTLFLSMKADIVERKYTSYGLKNIIAQEGWEAKDRQHYDASQIRYNYKDKTEWEKIKKYCSQDAEDSLKLFDKFIPPYFFLAQTTPKRLQNIIEGASGSQINSILVRSYLQEGWGIPKAADKVEYQGAISEGNSGIYNNVFKVDVTSLYPSIILQYELYDKQKDPKGNLLKLTKEFTNSRIAYKKLYQETKQEYYNHLQQIGKIGANSIYGFLGAPGLNFNSPSIASFITEKGREVLTNAVDWCNYNNFKLVNCDTDSISFCKQNGEPISQDERATLLKDLNSYYPEKIRFADDGYYPKVVVLKAKNYILLKENGKLIFKGSGLRASTKEKALQEFLQAVGKYLIYDLTNDLPKLYNDYIIKCFNINSKEDMSPWSFRKTITEKVLTPKRTNESKVLDAIEGEEVSEGDRRWFYFTTDGSLKLIDNFNNDYDPYKLIAKVYNTLKIFSAVVDMSQFTKYHLKGKRKELQTLIGEKNAA